MKAKLHLLYDELQALQVREEQLKKILEKSHNTLTQLKVEEMHIRSLMHKDAKIKISSNKIPTELGLISPYPNTKAEDITENTKITMKSSQIESEASAFKTELMLNSSEFCLCSEEESANTQEDPLRVDPANTKGEILDCRCRTEDVSHGQYEEAGVVYVYEEMGVDTFLQGLFDQDPEFPEQQPVSQEELKINETELNLQPTPLHQCYILHQFYENDEGEEDDNNGQ